MRLTHIYYNPETNSVSYTQKDGYVAFVNAEYVTKERESESEKKDLEFYKRVIDVLFKDNMHMKVDMDFERGSRYAWIVFTFGLVMAMSFVESWEIILIVSGIVYTGIMLHYFTKAKHSHRIYDRLEFGGIEKVEDDREDKEVEDGLG